MMNRSGPYALQAIRHRLESCSFRVHNAAWGKTQKYGQEAWKAVGMQVYSRLHVRVWGSISRW